MTKGDERFTNTGKDADRIEPVRPRSLLGLLVELAPIGETFPPIHDAPAEPVET